MRNEKLSEDFLHCIAQLYDLGIHIQTSNINNCTKISKKKEITKKISK